MFPATLHMVVAKSPPSFPSMVGSASFSRRESLRGAGTATGGSHRGVAPGFLLIIGQGLGKDRITYLQLSPVHRDIKSWGIRAALCLPTEEIRPANMDPSQSSRCDDGTAN